MSCTFSGGFRKAPSPPARKVPTQAPFWRSALVSGLSCVFYVGTLCTPPAANASPQPSSDVVIVIRNASESDLRLAPDKTLLRSLARRGVSFPELPGVERKSLLESLRALGRELGGRYRELNLRDRTDGGALDELEAQLGKLRQEKPVAAGAPAEPTGPENEVVDSTTLGGRLEEVLSQGAKLVLVLDQRARRESATGDTTLGELRDLVFGVPNRGQAGIPDRVLGVFLFPKQGSPALILGGHSLKKGRVTRRRLGVEDFVAGVRGWLSLSNSSRGSAAWIRQVKFELKRTKEADR